MKLGKCKGCLCIHGEGTSPAFINVDRARVRQAEGRMLISVEGFAFWFLFHQEGRGIKGRVVLERTEGIGGLGLERENMLFREREVQCTPPERLPI